VRVAIDSLGALFDCRVTARALEAVAGTMRLACEAEEVAAAAEAPAPVVGVVTNSAGEPVTDSAGNLVTVG
jgi:hypothetical protein